MKLKAEPGGLQTRTGGSSLADLKTEFTMKRADAPGDHP